MEGVESEGNGIGALEKLANKLTGFLSDCMTVQVHSIHNIQYTIHVHVHVTNNMYRYT